MENRIQRCEEYSLGAPRGTAQVAAEGSHCGQCHSIIPQSSEEETVLLPIKFADDTKLGEETNNNKDMSVLQFHLDCLVGGAHLSIYTLCSETRCRVIHAF